MTVHGPVHRSWVRFTWTQSLCNTESVSFTKTKSPCFTRVPVEVRLLPVFWYSRRSRLCSWRCCRSLRTSCIWQRASLLSAMILCNLFMPSLSGLGEVASIWVQQSRPNSKRKGWLCLAGVNRVLSNVARGLAAHIHPIAEASFCKVLRGFYGSTPLASLQPLEPLGDLRCHRRSSH